MRPDPSMPGIVVSSVTIALPGPGESPRVVCYATVVLNDAIRVFGCKLIACDNGRIRFFWPHRKDKKNGQALPHLQCFDESVRAPIEWAVLRAYRAHLAGAESDPGLGKAARYAMVRREVTHAAG